MIANDQEFEITRNRIESFQKILEQIRGNADSRDFEAMASGYRLEIERMQAEVMDFLLRPVIMEGHKQPA